MTKKLKEKKHNSVGYRKMPFNALKTYFADAFLKEYKIRLDDDGDHRAMLDAIKEYHKDRDWNGLYDWIEEYFQAQEGFGNQSFVSDLLSDIKDNMRGHRGIADDIYDEFQKIYCPDHGISWDKTTDSTKYICSDCEKKEEEEADVDCECCDGTYTMESCQMTGGKMTCNNCLDECQYSEECKVK